MKIYNNNGTFLMEIEPEDDSYRRRAIMGDNKVYLHFLSTQSIDIPINSYIEYMGERYTLYRPLSVEKSGKRNFSYTASFEGYKETLKKYKYKFLSSVPFEIKFTLTAKPRVFLQLLVDNLNRSDSGWSIGTCIEATEKTLSFNINWCYDVLNTLANEFNTEWDIENKRISLRKVEKFKTDPLIISYGMGKGLKPGISKQSTKETFPPSILLVQGGDQNISYKDYGSHYLHLPLGQELTYEGRRYRTDPTGTYIYRADKPLTDKSEEAFDGTNIYPSRVGEVTKVESFAVDEQIVYDIIDETIPQSLDFSSCIMEGTTMTIKFQTGALTGREFDVQYVHEERRFKITNQAEGNIIYPGTAPYIPQIGDKYAVFNIALPASYYCDDATQSGAAWEMFREAVRFFYENEDRVFSIKGALDGLFTSGRWAEVGDKIVMGGYIRFSDEDICPEPLLIRIISVREYLCRRFAPEIELTNKPVGVNVNSEIDKIGQGEVSTDDKVNKAVSFTQRRFRDSKETLEMLAGALLNFSGSINPVTVHTMMMLLGDESLQYRFVNNKVKPSAVGHIITFDDETRTLHVPSGIIQHMTLGINSVSSTHKVSEYKFWDMEEFYFQASKSEPEAYYLYAKVSKTNQSGTFLVSKTAIKIDAVEGYYHLLVGVLNSEFENSRSFVELYGFTEITPGRVTTDRVVSADGQNFLDFVNNAFRVGNNAVYLDFNTKGDGKFRLKGIIVQSESGDESFIGCFRGEYNSTYTYYEGDDITYWYSGGTSMYRYIYPTPGKGYPPTDTSRWKLIASKGSNGVDGDDGNDGIDGSYFEYRYAVNGSRTTPPSLSKTSTYPAGWVTEMPAVGALQYLWCTVAKKDANGWLLSYWSTPTRLTGYDGIDGAKGDTGPALAYQGFYDPNKRYFGTSKRVDAVKYKSNGLYYVARVDAGSGFYNHVPTDTNYWNEFGNQFENVATNLLLAEQASIGSWWHSGGKIVSTLNDGNKITLDASMAQIIIESAYSGGQSSLNRYLGAKITLDATNGIVEARGKSDTSKVAYMSPSGIFCNSANTQAVSSIYGSDVRAAIVGLGYGNVSRDDVYQLGNFLAGVYGVASNSGNAPAYGGYFRDLMAAGLILNRRVVESGGVYLNSYDTFVVGYSQSECSVYLPNDGVIGRIVLLKQRNVGSMKCYARGGQKIYDDDSVNTYFRVPCGSLVIAIFDRCYINNVLTEAWLINSINTLINN